jgi:mannose-6-phosphate isomerase-like protein (cupin superfamily)
MDKKPFVVDLNNKFEFQRLLPGEPQTCGMKSGRVYLAPGESCGRHSTNDREELLVFLAGSGKAIIEGSEAFNVGVGKVAYIPPHTFHDIKNTSTEPLIYVYCVAPAGLSRPSALEPER